MKTWSKHREYNVGSITASFYIERDYLGRVLGFSIEGHKAHPNEWCDNPAYISISFVLLGVGISATLIFDDRS